MIKWERLGKTVNAMGETVIAYTGAGTGLRIMSIKRQIPHANRTGSWAHTFFEVYADGEKVTETHSLTRAKEIAEELAAKGGANP